MDATLPPPPTDHRALIAEVLGEDGHISADDVLKLRRAFYRDGMLESAPCSPILGRRPPHRA